MMVVIKGREGGLDRSIIQRKWGVTCEGYDEVAGLKSEFCFFC